MGWGGVGGTVRQDEGPLYARKIGTFEVFSFLMIQNKTTML